LKSACSAFNEPDGYCLHCQQPENQRHPVGPIVVAISDPYCDDLTHQFCEWRCFAKWVATQAGGEFVMLKA
jgi:hypothetical protein